jgi:hypothetical protein
MTTTTRIDARQRAEQLQRQLRETLTLARADIERLDDPKAQALCETTAEVLQGLVTAYEHYAAKSEAAWR